MMYMASHDLAMHRGIAWPRDVTSFDNCRLLSSPLIPSATEVDVEGSPPSSGVTRNTGLPRLSSWEHIWPLVAGLSL